MLVAKPAADTQALVATLDGRSAHEPNRLLHHDPGCALLDRLKGDQIQASPQQLKEYSEHTVSLVLNYIRAKLSDA